LQRRSRKPWAQSLTNPPRRGEKGREGGRRQKQRREKGVVEKGVEHAGGKVDRSAKNRKEKPALNSIGGNRTEQKRK